jgi:hypothetical protein
LATVTVESGDRFSLGLSVSLSLKTNTRIQRDKKWLERGKGTYLGYRMDAGALKLPGRDSVCRRTGSVVSPADTRCNDVRYCQVGSLCLRLIPVAKDYVTVFLSVVMPEYSTLFRIMEDY